jgi:hypothetical protein
VERSAHREQDAPFPAPRRGERHRSLDRGPVAGHDDLPRRVDVRDVHDLALRGFPADLLDDRQLQAQDGGHRPRAHGHGLLHELAPTSHDADGVCESQGARHDQGGVLTQAVPADHGRHDPALGQEARAGDAHREHRRLSVRRELKLGLGPLEAELGDVEPEGGAGLLEDHARRGRRIMESAPHPHGLRALARKAERQGRVSGHGHRWTQVRARCQ